MDPATQKAARDELEADLEALRRHGVKSFAQTPAGFTVEFFPEAEAAMPEKAPGKDPDVCNCGHAEHFHMNGYCSEGCTAEQCDKKKATS